jgi:hypothetical protein
MLTQGIPLPALDQLGGSFRCKHLFPPSAGTGVLGKADEPPSGLPLMREGSGAAKAPMTEGIRLTESFGRTALRPVMNHEAPGRLKTPRLSQKRITVGHEAAEI